MRELREEGREIERFNSGEAGITTEEVDSTASPTKERAVEGGEEGRLSKPEGWRERFYSGGEGKIAIGVFLGG